MRCPKCGGEHCQVISETTSKGKDFSAALLGPIGILCGACGKGKQINSTNYWVCQDCGNKFKV